MEPQLANSAIKNKEKEAKGPLQNCNAGEGVKMNESVQLTTLREMVKVSSEIVTRHKTF